MKTPANLKGCKQEKQKLQWTDAEDFGWMDTLFKFTKIFRLIKV